MAVSQNLTITQVSQSIANRTSTIRILWTTTQSGSSYNNYNKEGTCAVYLNGSTSAYKTYSVSSTLPLQSTKTILDTTLVVEHSSTGECTVSVRTSMATGLNAGTIELSKNLTLDTIHQASTLTASDGILGKAQTLTINRHSNNFTHSIRYDCGTASGAVCTKVSGTSVLFTPPEGLAKQNKTGSTVSVKLTLYTFYDDKEIGRTTKNITCTIPDSEDFKPSCSISYAEETNHIKTYGSLIQGRSRLRVTITPELAFESPIVAYNVSVDGTRYSSNSFTTGVLKNSGNVLISVTVTDSRNRTGTASLTVPNVMEYSAPSISSLTVHRCDANGTENDQGEFCQVSFSAFIHSLSGKNTSEFELEYKKTSATEYTLVSLTELNNRTGEVTYTCDPFPADSGSPYDITVYASDNFGSADRSTSVSTAETIMHISADGSTVCFGGVSTKPNAHQIRKPIYDRFDMVIANGLAAYGGAGDAAIDPDTTTEELVLTNKNTPISGQFMYIRTMFYNTKSATANRAQIATPYKASGNMYHRFYFSGVWSDWERQINASDILDMVYPVGSYYISHSNTSPATLFGGTWARIEGRMLYGCATTGTIGATGTHTTGSGSSSLPYVNVAIWRRTA